MIFIDTCVWLAFFRERDEFHSLAKELILEYQQQNIWINVLIIEEIVTLLTYKEWKKCWDMFIDFLDENSNIHIYDFNINELLSYYKIFNNKISLADISLVYLAKNYWWSILTFDKELNKIAKRIN